MATPQTTNNGQIVKKPPQSKDLRALLNSMGGEIARALPKHVAPDRMLRIALTALSATPKLAQCTPESFLGSIVQAAQLGLEVNTPLGHAYLLPFEDRRNNRTLCQLIIGYQGMIDLARRSGMVKAVYAFPVYAGDEFSWELGLNPTIKHKPSAAEHKDSDLTHVYAVAKLEGGEPIFTVLTRAEVEKYRKRSRASSSGPWVTDFEAMALKTAIRRLFRWLPKSAEMARAAEIDEAPEIGKAQLAAADPEVLGYLSAQGMDVEGATQPVQDVDPDTGEVVPPPTPEREPGADG
jgi:recombination protein RecT